MDNNIFEIIFLSSASPKLGTEYFLTEYYRKNGYNILKAALKAEETLPYFLQFTSNLLEKSTSINVPYIFLTVTKNILILNPSYFPIKEIHRKLIAMDWRDFENFSADILQTCFNAFDVITTPPTADGGLDFFGKIPITSICNRQTYGFIEVYGQSKRYSNNVGIYEVKAFEAFANNKKRKFAHHPQLFMFFTSSDFAHSSEDLLKENGSIGFSGLQLSNLVYFHKELLEQKSKIYRQTFTEVKTTIKPARPEEKIGQG